jgi:hypothetical protein
MWVTHSTLSAKKLLNNKKRKNYKEASLVFYVLPKLLVITYYKKAKIFSKYPFTFLNRCRISI